MKLSVMLFPFHGQLSDGTRTAAQVIDALGAVGVTAIEPMMGWMEEDPKTWAAFDLAVREAGMVYSCCDLGVNFVGECPPDQDQALDIVERGVEFCREKLKCTIALVAGTRPAAGMSDVEGRKIYAEGLARAAERVEGSGVALAIEDFGVYPTFTATAAHCLETLRAANRDDIKFAFDNGNFLLGDDTPTHAYPLMKDRIIHVHIKDLALRDHAEPRSYLTPSGKRFSGCTIGDGAAEVAECIGLLKADRLGGWLSLEVGGSGDPLDEAVHGAKVVADAEV